MGSLTATAAHLDRALWFIDRQEGSGGTELLGGLEAAYLIPRRGDASRTVVVVTDGYVGIESTAYKFVRERLNDTNLFALDIGRSVNRSLIEGPARAGQGERFVVLNMDEASAAAAKPSAYILQPVLTTIHARFEGFDAIDATPTRVPDLMARRPLVLLGRYRGEAAGKIVLSGQTPAGPWSQTIVVRPVAAKPENLPIRWLWARKWVATLLDEHHLSPLPELTSAITDLDLAYSLLTPYTSFVAIDSDVVNPGGQNQTVRQPQAMPEGVSKFAIAGGQQGNHKAILGALGSAGQASRLFGSDDDGEGPGGPEFALAGGNHAFGFGGREYAVSQFHAMTKTE